MAENTSSTQYAVIPMAFDLSDSRENVPMGIGNMNRFFVRSLTNPNANLTVRFGTSSSPAISLKSGDSFEFAGTFIEAFISNDSVTGKLELILSNGITVIRPQTITNVFSESFTSSARTIAATATAIPATALAGRKEILLQSPSGAADIFIGDSGVSTGTGVLLSASSTMTIQAADNVIVYGIVATGTQAIRISEGA